MRDDIAKLPIYKKAEEIFQLTDALIKTLPVDDEFLQETTVRFMLEDAMIIPVKISGAEAVELYDLKMDPQEQKNLIKSPVHQKVVLEMKNELLKLRNQYDDHEKAGELY